MADTRTAARTRPATVLRIGLLLILPALVVLGVEGWRHFDNSRSVKEVEEAYEASIDHFGRPDNWQQHFETRRPGRTGAAQARAWSNQAAADIGDTSKLTGWVLAVLGTSRDAQPSPAEAAAFLEKSAGASDGARGLLKFDYLDGAPAFLAGGEVEVHIESIYGLRVMQLRAALLNQQGNRDAAMRELETLLELTARCQTPLALFELLVMQIAEATTHLLVGRMAETGPLSLACEKALRRIIDAPDSRATVIEGEMAVNAWRYHSLGVESMSISGTDQGGLVEWFDWGNFSSTSDLNREIAAYQRDLLEISKAWGEGREPAPVTDFGRQFARNTTQAFAELRLWRVRTDFALKVRAALDSGADPATLAAQTTQAGLKLEHTPEGWRLAHQANAEQLAAALATTPADFERVFSTLLFR